MEKEIDSDMNIDLTNLKTGKFMLEKINKNIYSDEIKKTVELLDTLIDKCIVDIGSLIEATNKCNETAAFIEVIELNRKMMAGQKQHENNFPNEFTDILNDYKNGKFEN